MSDKYERQYPIIGKQGQVNLCNKVITVVGVGGLGTAVATYLAYAGAENLRLIDNDKVSITNLNRQILYNDLDLNLYKVLAATEALKKINPYCEIEPSIMPVEKGAVDCLLERSSVIIDCLDNFNSRKLLLQSAIRLNIPVVIGMVGGLSGYVTTVKNNSACPWCLFDKKPDISLKSDGAILGATCGIIGSIQALEAIKLITGTGVTLHNEILYWNGFASNMMTFSMDKNKDCVVCGSTKTI